MGRKRKEIRDMRKQDFEERIELKHPGYHLEIRGYRGKFDAVVVNEETGHEEHVGKLTITGKPIDDDYRKEYGYIMWVMPIRMLVNAYPEDWCK